MDLHVDCALSRALYHLGPTCWALIAKIEILERVLIWCQLLFYTFNKFIIMFIFLILSNIMGFPIFPKRGGYGSKVLARGVRIRDIGGGGTPLGGVIYTPVGEKIGVFIHVFGAEGGAKNVWALFCKFWGDFLIKEQLKVDFGVICVEVSRKNFNNDHFFEKIHLHRAENFESISTQVPSPPSKYLWLG